MAPRHSGWRHGVMRMWSGSERALLRYQEATCAEWTGRGYRDTCMAKSRYVVDLVIPAGESEQWPPWWGEPHLHLTHRSNLVWKDKPFYGPQFPDATAVPPESPESESSYWEYWYPDGAIPLVQRMDQNYDRACSVLGSPSVWE